MLYREPKLLKAFFWLVQEDGEVVSVLYREPKLLKAKPATVVTSVPFSSFSALP